MLEFKFTDEQIMLKETVKDFTTNEIKPIAAKIDSEGKIPPELIKKMAELGFITTKFMNADVVLDGGIGGNCPASHAYFINTNYLFYRPHRNREFVPIGDERFSTNQDAVVRLIGWAGNMTCSGAQFQGVIQT